MSEPESGWFSCSFDFKFVNADLDLHKVDTKKLIQGLGRALAYLLLSEDLTNEEMDRVKILVAKLVLMPSDFLSDDQINRAISGWNQGEDQ